MQSAIIWPTKFLPGTTDNYVSNEVIVRDITAAQIWTYLADITQWESYYNNCSHITPPVGGNNLKKGDSFSFSTFGFPPLSGRSHGVSAAERGLTGTLGMESMGRWGREL
ncbi:hypothetical protein AU210_008612 [Fusarium oxysporum f. sp. radicis-cucumerinum]|uniref:Uncharacterized protein n=1 Tax=Fusarium oxysporum f. sp. radicis-cucumerinum TaxID=327505 RepID=A0A2H3H2F3_FUSOX|nr:hypothetical protein AU210_008612 [Fusarium oxysporum f. sp. radicis-cucumerinum]